jgi:hypothetical protein
LGKLLGIEGLTLENSWEKWDYMGKCWEKSGIIRERENAGKKVGLTWENCWEKWD